MKNILGANLRPESEENFVPVLGFIFPRTGNPALVLGIGTSRIKPSVVCYLSLPREGEKVENLVTKEGQFIHHF